MSDSEGPRQVENLKGAITLAVAALQSLAIVNGGAVISILTFYGNVAAKSPAAFHIDRIDIKAALISFALGVAFDLFAFGFAYLSQLESATKTNSRCERPIRIAAIGCGFASALLFLFGVVLAAISLR
jgi:hypothetical protein